MGEDRQICDNDTIYLSISMEAAGIPGPTQPIDDFASTQCSTIRHETVHGEPIGLRTVPKIMERQKRTDIHQHWGRS